MWLVRFIMISLCFSGFAAQAQTTNMPEPDHDTPLSNSELSAVFDGQTHRGSYNFRRKDIDTFAFEETTKSGGDIRHVQGGRVDTGDWSLTGNRICYRYDAEGLLPACFEIYQRGNCYYHYQKTINGVALESFTARSVIKGDHPDCAPQIS